MHHEATFHTDKEHELLCETTAIKPEKISGKCVSLSDSSGLIFQGSPGLGFSL